MEEDDVVGDYAGSKGPMSVKERCKFKMCIIIVAKESLVISSRHDVSSIESHE